ncbi:MAG: TIGR00159 family protein [Deltaproteobacteria bacterium]|nr:TIGR00159 family protein [Deltaproteobacteria bacterium]
MFETFTALPIITAIDIALVAVVLYWVMLLVKGTRGERMLWGLAVVVLVYFAAERMELLTLHWILNNFLGSIVIVIIVVFQQDIRRALVQMGRPFTNHEAGATGFLDEISGAVAAMSSNRMGGLIVIERGIDLRDFLESGVNIDAEVSRELILTIFDPSSPLHDGAVFVRGGRIARAGCILPLTEKKLAGKIGTRHMAAVGLSEETDAAVIVISEKTGEVSLVFDEKLELGIALTELVPRLKGIISTGGGEGRVFFPWRPRA